MTLIRKILDEVLLPAIGCTEVGAIALAAATAYKGIGGNVEQITVLLDSNTFKNAAAVAIPNTGGEIGIGIVAALGALYGNPELKLSILRDIGQEDTKIAKEMVCQSKIQVDIRSEQFPVYIDITVETSQGRGRAIIKGSHTNIVFIELNGEVKFGDKARATEPEAGDNDTRSKLLAMKIPQIISLAASLEPEDIQFLLEGAEMNMAIAREGLSKRSGLAVGSNLQEIAERDSVSENVINEARILVSAAVDARVSGSGLSVMTNSGSGNQGIATTIPINVVSRRMNSDRLELARALASGHLLAAYTRLKMGELSTICGSVVASAIGAGVGILCLHDKKEELVDRVVKNVVASIAGIFCDGAKESCALKLATASGVAVEAALLSMQNMEVAANGIIAGSAEETLDNLSLISKSMGDTEQSILSIILNKVREPKVVSQR